MQGKQNAGNMERKGPHKSMHCKFCKPPGAVAIEKPSPAQLETNTRVHLIHEGADLRLRNVHNEPGFPSPESEACMCILEGENPCPKCVPDKSRPPLKKKVCRCPKGAKPHPSMYKETAPKKKKLKEEDDEFWWEKYSREHDAIAKETWAAYMAQRRKDKKLDKCQKKELERAMIKLKKGIPLWYQKLSCQQMIYVEFLSTAIRLDSDENITDRTHFVLGGIGLYPRPNRKFIKKCLRYCHYNAVQFLNQLHLLTKDVDPFQEKYIPPSSVKKNLILYTWNEVLIMNAICYLEFPAILRELMDRLPPLPREEILPQIPYPVFPVTSKKKYSNPYEEPIWQDRLNWLEKSQIDRLNRCRTNMETKRVKIPPLALVRRSSLIDARPPFLAQIEANERASRRLVEEKKKKLPRKHPISTFNSAVDVTAIAGIEASEISTTDKADTDDICVFLREPKESESTEGGETEEESDFPLAKEVRFLEEGSTLEETQGNRKKIFSDLDNSVEGEAEDIPFKTPPKTESGATIASPCPPPDATPGPPALHYDSGKRELDIINEEICRFFPFVSSSRQTVKEDIGNDTDNVELKLKSAAAKLKKLTKNEQDTESRKSGKKKKKNLKKKGKCKKRNKKKTKKSESCIDRTLNMREENMGKDQEEEEEEEEEIQENNAQEEDDLEDGDDLRVTYKKKERYRSNRESELSDPDPDTDDDWPTRPPCTPDASQLEEQKKPVLRRKHKRKGKTSKRRTQKKKVSKRKCKGTELKEMGVHMKKKEISQEREIKEMTMNNHEITYNENQDEKKEAKGKEEENEQQKEEKGKDVFRGKIMPLVQEIIEDLAEEGFCCASYPNLKNHPDVEQLILHLQGKILNNKLRKKLMALTKLGWSSNKELHKFPIPELGISRKKLWAANWNDKKWISKIAKSKIDQFYYKVARSRAEFGGDIYKTLNQSYFITDRYLKVFYAYMTSKYEDAILRGIF